MDAAHPTPGDEVPSPPADAGAEPRPSTGPAATPPALARPFRIIAFDWDGTAVASRSEDAGPLRDLLEALLRLDVMVVVITGTSFANIDRQLSAAMRGPHKRQLYVATNRGSEVYGFDAESRPVLVWQRRASPEEDRRLTAIADALRDAIVARTGLAIGVVYDRLNRRKVDLIPLPAWRDPPKSAIGALLQAVETRLRGAGLVGGLAEAVELAEQLARATGLPAARITSDVKHVEVGLTDKADAVGWVMRELARPRGIPPADVLIAGDEFGPIAGVAGSDDKMVTPAAHGAVYVSVGPEPGGVPPAVIHLGGGPVRFRDLLAEQVTRHGPPAPTPDLPATLTADPAWLLIEPGFDLAREHEVESLFAVANGYVGTRGSLAERSRLSAPATYVAGIFAPGPEPASVPELVRVPDWTHLRVMVEDQALTLDAGDILEHRRVLDLRQAILWREWRHRDPAGRVTRLRFLRLASLADRHLLLQALTLTPENYSARLRVESRIELPVRHTGQSSAARPLLIPDPTAATAGEAAGPGVLVLRTTSTGIVLTLAAASHLVADDGRMVPPVVEAGPGWQAEAWEWEAEIGRTYRLDRLVAIHSTRDDGQPATAAAHVQRRLNDGVERVVTAHTDAWAARWQATDVEVEGDAHAQRALRFAIYHLVSTANPADERVSIGARALTGDAYKGHVFWDTEIYLLPFYTFTDPPAARALLLYRYHTLPAARAKAHRLGYRGALYAWESTDSGDETTPSTVLTPDGEVVHILTGEQEHHISADVAYAVWRYWRASGDDAFFRDAGAEMMLETARFWASRGRLEADGRYHIRQVIGPDEYHESVDDNAYTNGLAQWNLERGAETARMLAERWPARWRNLAAQLEIAPQEPERWRHLAAVMATGFDPRTGLFEQFQGYFDLEEIDLTAYEPRVVPMDVLLGRERTRRSQVIKQADVVLLLYLLWDHFPAAVRAANFDYYAPRTAHGSSLSPAIHALVAARLGKVALAERFFRQAAEIDLANTMGNAAGGVHAAALGGLWQAAVLGFGGVWPRADALALAPMLPRHWQRLRVSLRWRAQPLAVAASKRPPTVTVTLAGPAPMRLALADGAATELAPGRRYVASRHGTRWEPWQAAPASPPAAGERRDAP